MTFSIINLKSDSSFKIIIKEICRLVEMELQRLSKGLEMGKRNLYSSNLLNKNANNSVLHSRQKIVVRSLKFS